MSWLRSRRTCRCPCVHISRWHSWSRRVRDLDARLRRTCAELASQGPAHHSSVSAGTCPRMLHPVGHLCSHAPCTDAVPCATTATHCRAWHTQHAADCLTPLQRYCDGSTFVTAQGGPVLTFSARVPGLLERSQPCTHPAPRREPHSS